MKNDYIKVPLSIVLGALGIIGSLGVYAYAQTNNGLEKRIKTVEDKADEALAVRAKILERVTRTEEQVTALSKQFEMNRADTKEADRMRDQKIDKILEQVNQIQRQTK